MLVSTRRYVITSYYNPGVSDFSSKSCGQGHQYWAINTNTHDIVDCLLQEQRYQICFLLIMHENPRLHADVLVLIVTIICSSGCIPFNYSNC